MAKEYDISTQSLDDIELAVNSYDPYSLSEPSSFTPTMMESPQEGLSDEDMLKANPQFPTQDGLSDEEMFDQGDSSYRVFGVDLPNGFVEGYKNVVDKTTNAAVKGVWKGLGALSWPFERIEYGIGTPIESIIRAVGPIAKIGSKFEQELFLRTPYAKNRYKDSVRSMITPYAKSVLGDRLEPMLDDQVDRFANGWLTSEEIKSNLTEAKEQSLNIVPSIIKGAKSFVPFTHNDPEKVKNFNDVWGAYYEEMTGETAPEWYKQTAGVGTSYLVTPVLFGKVLKATRLGFQKLPFIRKILANKLPSWEDAKLMRRASIFEKNEKAAKLGKTLADKDARRIAHQLSLKTGKTITKEAVKQRLGQIIKGSITQQSILSETANPVIEELSKNFDELQKLGILGEETFLTKLSKAKIADLNSKKAKLTKQLTRLETAPHYVGTQEISAKFPGRAKRIKELQSQIDSIDETLFNATHFGGSGQLYMPRMYATKEAEIAARKFPVTGAGPKVKAPYAKKRANLTLEERKELGEFFEPAYPVTKRLIQEAQDIETAKLFDFASKQGGWVDDIWHEGLFEKALPDTKSYGALAGKYVHPKIYADVTELNRAKSNFEKIYDSIIGTWKTGKVTLNPSTHFRNTMSNSILLDLSGTDHIQQSRLFVKALNEIKAGSAEYKEARKFFGHTSMMTGEIMDDLLKTVNKDTATGLQKTINTWNSMYGKAMAGPRAVYQEEEFIFKFMKFIEQREKGKSVMGAVREANKWLFDYSDLNHFEKTVMRRVMPFYCFPRKALPRILEAAEKNPLSLAKYPVIAWAQEKYALHKLELTDKDYAEIQKVLPEYMQSGSYMLMPFRDSNGDLRFFDWTYIVPWGELYDAQDKGLLGAVVTNPMIQVTADIMRNKSGFSGREIWQESDTPEEQTFKKMIHLWQAAVPSLMYKGIYWDKLYNAATGKPSKMGDITPLAPTIAHTIFGARTQAIDVEDQTMFRMYDKMKLAEELEKKIADITLRASNGNITEEEYNEKREQYIGQIQSLFSEEGESD